jgi:hypothetical protein
LHAERLPALAADLASRRVSVIFATTSEQIGLPSVRVDQFKNGLNILWIDLAALREMMLQLRKRALHEFALRLQSSLSLLEMERGDAFLRGGRRKKRTIWPC